MLPGSVNRNGLLPFPRLFGRINAQVTAQVFSRKTFLMLNNSIIITRRNYFSTQVTGQRSHIYNMICLAHHHLVMLHHNNRISEVAQLFKHNDQPLGIAGVKTNGRFIEDI